MITRNFIRHGCQTDKVKIETHGRFDGGLSDLSLEHLPPNVNCLLRSDDWQSLKDVQADISANDLRFHVCPFSKTFVGTIPKPCTSDTCGLALMDDLLSKQSHVTAIDPTSSSSTILNEGDHQKDSRYICDSCQ